ncbi:MAG: A/G-specific adenine glycosylase [Myxococcota bacterium]
MRLPAVDVRNKLLAWYRAHRRDLPWRRTRDPYAIWVSEIMLQQTRVDTVIPYYNTFLQRWPNVRALAQADPDDVRAAWSGLGYYRRARLMLEAAQTVSEQYDGQFPADLDALRALPGFGRYTAGAVASIAFDLPAPAVDGNVARVLARLGAISGDVTRGAPQKEVWSLATSLAPGESPGEHTQAMIELGALVCATKQPKCLLCPVTDACAARADGKIHEIPPPRRKAARKSVWMTALICHSRRRVLMMQQPDDGLFAGLWTPPMLQGDFEANEATDQAQTLQIQCTGAEMVGEFKHVLTHRDLHVRVVRLNKPRCSAAPPFRWFALSDLETLGLPSLTIKTLRMGLSSDELAAVTLPGRRTSRRP